MIAGTRSTICVRRCLRLYINANFRIISYLTIGQKANIINYKFHILYFLNVLRGLEIHNL